MGKNSTPRCGTCGARNPFNTPCQTSPRPSGQTPRPAPSGGKGK
jgi:hypothetical protein